MDTSAFRGEKEVNVRVIPKWIWTEWVQVCTQLKKYPAVNIISKLSSFDDLTCYLPAINVVLFTEPTAANGVTISKVVYQAELVPEKWLKKLLKNSDKELAERVEAPQRQSVTLVLTNQGWRDLRELR